jgi:hypothetical protein
MLANDRQVGGEHYKTDNGLQHWDIVDIFNLGYFEGQITKYLFRWKKKGGIKDLEKAQHFLEKYIEIEKAKLLEFTAPTPPEELPPVNKRRSIAPSAPRSDDDYTYEGGTKILDMYRCRQCKVHFEIPLNSDPRTYHTHDNGSEATRAYVAQD